jgi:uncharacterized membrane protein (UPF0127 family)
MSSDPNTLCDMSGDDDRFAGLPRRELDDGRVVIQAANGRARRRGLSRLDALPAAEALHIPHCPAVHTFGMRFALDLIWLSGNGSVARVDRNVGPRQMRICVQARSVVETNAGQADAFLGAGLAPARVP